MFNELLAVEFIMTPDETGKGRIVVGGKFYGCPIDVLAEYKRLRSENDRLQDENAGLVAACDSLEATVYGLGG